MPPTRPLQITPVADSIKAQKDEAKRATTVDNAVADSVKSTLSADSAKKIDAGRL